VDAVPPSFSKGFDCFAANLEADMKCGFCGEAPSNFGAAFPTDRFSKRFF